jgi:hypothetical protein
MSKRCRNTVVGRAPVDHLERVPGQGGRCRPPRLPASWWPHRTLQGEQGGTRDAAPPPRPPAGRRPVRVPFVAPTATLVGGSVAVGALVHGGAVLPDEFFLPPSMVAVGDPVQVHPPVDPAAMGEAVRSTEFAKLAFGSRRDGRTASRVTSRPRRCARGSSRPTPTTRRSLPAPSGTALTADAQASQALRMTARMSSNWVISRLPSNFTSGLGSGSPLDCRAWRSAISRS